MPALLTEKTKHTSIIHIHRALNITTHFFHGKVIVVVVIFVVAPVLKKATKSGVERLFSERGKTAELKCITERSYPAAVFKWSYQLLDCTTVSLTCPSAKPDGWRTQLPSTVTVEQRSSNVSVLVIPGNIETLYFRCIAENPLARDFIQYQFIRTSGK